MATKRKVMKKLGTRNYSLISRMAKTTGNFDPDDSLYVIEEELYVDEYETIIEFLTWLHTNNLGVGHGNYESRFQEFLTSQK